MKKMMSVLLAVLMMGTILVGCGSKGGSESGKEEQPVDLTAVWQEVLALDEEMSEDYFGDMAEEPDVLESYYPGLKDIPAKQLVARAPFMSAVVNEYVFMECETEEDAAKAAEILQVRVDDQANGGAWYPESMAAWEKAQVLTNGRYVAMVASAQLQDQAAEVFNSKFA